MRGLHQSHATGLQTNSTVAFSHMEYLLEDLFSLGSPGGPSPASVHVSCEMVGHHLKSHSLCCLSLSCLSVKLILVILCVYFRKRQDKLVPPLIFFAITCSCRSATLTLHAMASVFYFKAQEFVGMSLPVFCLIAWSAYLVCLGTYRRTYGSRTPEKNRYVG